MNNTNDIVGNMNKYIWRLRYAIYMLKQTGMPWRFCLQAAEAAINDPDTYPEYSPHEAVDIELSYWND